MDIKGSFIIAEPCHEDWNNMTPETQGRFCASCKKCVIDMTTKSAVEIQQIYEVENGDVCARMNISQLKAKPATSKVAGFRFLPKAMSQMQKFAFALVTAFAFLFSSPVQAQKGGEFMGKIAYVHHDGRINGHVKWDSGSPAAEATITLTQGDYIVASTTADAQGQFELANLRGGTYLLTASFGGYVQESKTIELKEGASIKENLILQDRHILGDTIYVPEELVAPIIVPVDSSIDPELCLIPENEIPAIDLPGENSDASQHENGFPIDPDLQISPLKPNEQINLNGRGMTIFPNPTPDRIHVSLDPTENADDVTLLLMDMNGVLLRKESWMESDGTNLEMDMSDLPAGVYILKMISGSESQSRRIVKQ